MLIQAFQTTNPGGRSFAFAAVLIVLYAFSSPADADTVHLKNGRKMTGIVLTEQSNSKNIMIKTTNGTLTIPRSNIARIDTRENMTPDEKEGDLVRSEGELDRALRLYQRGYSKQESAELKEKIDDLKAEIKQRDDRRFGQKFAQIDTKIEQRDFEEAVRLGRELLVSADTESVQKRCAEKISAAYIEQAREFRNRVDYPQAETAYRNAIREYSEGGVAQMELATHLDKNYPARYEEALKLYKQVLDIAERDPTMEERADVLAARHSYAKLLMSRKRYREAIKQFQLVIDDAKGGRFATTSDSIIASAFPIQAELRERNEENEALVEIIAGVVDGRPRDGKSNAMLGLIFYEWVEYERTVPHLKIALDNPSDAWAAEYVSDMTYKLGNSYRQLGEDALAAERFEAVLRDAPDQYDLNIELGDIYFDLKQYRGALDRFEMAIQLDSKRPEGFVGAGRVFRTVKKYPAAAQMYRKLTKLEPEERDHWYILALMLSEIEDTEDERFEVLMRVVELSAEDDREDPEVKKFLAEIHQRLGNTLITLKRYNESIEQLEMAQKYSDEDAPLVARTGFAYRELGHLEEAERKFNQAVELDPTKPDYVLSLGILFHKYHQDTSKALPYYMKYYEMGGSDPQVAEWIRDCGGTPPANI